MQHLPEVTDGRPGQTLDDVPENRLSKYYAVARGNKIGLFESYYGDNGSQKQTDGVPAAKHQSFNDRDDAIDYLVQNGIPRSKIRLYGSAFKEQPGFKPDYNASFNHELERFTESQKALPESARRQAGIDAIYNSLIQYLLPEGLSVDQVDEEEGPILNEAQTLKMYQGMCRMASKTVHNTIDDSLLELNRSPYVNIKGFFDTCRTSKPLTRLSKWEKFVDYTMKPGKKMNLKYAKNEFLTPLLQNLGSGANAVNPIRQRGRLLRERAQRLRERGLDADGNEISSRGTSDVSASPLVAASGSQSPRTNSSGSEEEGDHESEDQEEDAGDIKLEQHDGDIKLEGESEDEEQATVYGSDDDEQATVYGDEEVPASVYASSPPSLASVFFRKPTQHL
jgi:hypothetical protein